MSFVTKHLTIVDTALQLLATHQWTNVGFQRSKTSFLVLGHVLARTASGRALVLPAGAETSAWTIACWELIAVHAHLGANLLDTS